MQKKRVLHIFDSFNQGGIENFVMNVYRNIDREKVEFNFAFLYKGKGYFDDEALNLGANIYYFKTQKKSLLNYYLSLKKIIKENGPFDVIHSHCYFFSGFVLYVAKKCGVKVRIAHSHDTVKGRKATISRKIYENTMRRMINYCSTYKIGCSKAACEYLFGIKSDYSVVYNGIDVDRFRYDYDKRIKIRKKMGIDDKFVCLHVGRFTHQKNHEYLLKIFEQYQKMNTNSVLVLLGTGILMDNIKEIARRMNIEKKIIFEGDVNNTEDYYNASDCFIFPSRYEGLGIVLVEAQANGIPIIASSKITNEIKLRNEFEFVEIEDSYISKWCSKITSFSSYNNLREEAWREIKDTDFDILYTVDKLLSIYMA